MDEHDLTKHIWIQKLKNQKHNMNQIRKAIKTQSLKENSNTKVYGILSQSAQELVQDQMNKSAWVGSSTKHTKNKLKCKNSKTSKELK